MVKWPAVRLASHCEPNRVGKKVPRLSHANTLAGDVKSENEQQMLCNMLIEHSPCS